MSVHSQDWPKQYLLQIHAEAVKHGFVWIENISEADAMSLKQRLYRIRRRSDKGTASFIPPEYHLVTIGQYDAVNGRLPVIFNSLPDGGQLPRIVPASGEEIEQLSNMTLPAPPSPEDEKLLALEPEDLQLDADAITGLVERMKADAQKKVN